MAWVNLDELEARARDLLPPMVYDYFAGGSGDEVTLRDNRAAFDRWRLRYRVLGGVAVRDLGVTLLGARCAHPLLVAPMAFQRMAHPDGEIATVEAAGRTGTPMVLSTLSTVAVERVVGAATAPVWFQLYLYKDRGETAALVQRAEAAGCRALVLTVDAPLIGRRERDVRNAFHLPEPLRAENLLGTGMEVLGSAAHGSALSDYVARLIDPGLSWRDLDWLAGITRLPVVLKGVCHPDDADRACTAGVRALVVSNHGGRQLDGAPATIDSLPAVVDAVAGRCDVLLDGGVRRGTDVLKAVGLGARAVLIGRPVLWGLAVGGADGARSVIEHLLAELDLALALCGHAAISAVGRDLVVPGPRSDPTLSR
jgi:4-hydroxymandelate oxidase